MSDFSPTPEWLDERFTRRVVRETFHRPPQEQPVVVLLGAQPGAGKTRATEFAQQLHDGTLNVITGDDYRVLHPDYEQLQKDDPVGMPNITQQVSGPMVERAIAYARENNLSALVEGTFRNPEVSLGTAQEFHDAGYEVHVVALAVPPAVSRISAVARFYETLDEGNNRWTPLTAHENAVAHMPDTLEALGSAEVVDRLTLIDRSGTVLMDSSTPGVQRGADAAALLRTHHERPLTPAEREETARTYEANQVIARQHPRARSIAEETTVRSAWARLAGDRIIANQTPARSETTTRSRAPGRAQAPLESRRDPPGHDGPSL